MSDDDYEPEYEPERIHVGDDIILEVFSVVRTFHALVLFLSKCINIQSCSTLITCNSVCNQEKLNLTALCLLALLAPPLEYMASLHSRNQEISGRQVWTGSLTLAHALLELSDGEKRQLFENQRYHNFFATEPL
jgi:hypothetical protein